MNTNRLLRLLMALGLALGIALLIVYRDRFARKDGTFSIPYQTA